jgi:hypothetical protein
LASLIKASGKYNYKVKRLDAKVCEIEFYEDGKPSGTEIFTIEEAKQAGTKNIDKYPKNMLFARAISNGAKFYTPDVFGGAVYTEGEIQADQEPEVQGFAEEVVIIQPTYKISDSDLELLKSYSENPAIIEKKASLESLLKRCTSAEGTQAVLEGCKTIIDDYNAKNIQA